jgi:ribose transport system ATP-binding protein
MMPPALTGVLTARGICKRFPGVRALDDVSIRLRPGRLVALAGENGAGKSTLMSVLAGVITPDEGVISIDTRELRFRNTREARAAGIAAIFQELSLVPNLTVAENIFLGREPRTAWGTIDYQAMNLEAARHLARLGLNVAPDTRLDALRVGQQQVVEIARALSIQARVLILDEPTSALARHETESLLRLISELKKDGVALLYITHKFEELAGIADEVAVMRDGRLVAQASYTDLTHEQIVSLMVGGKASRHEVKSRGEQGRELLRAESISLPHGARRGDYVIRDVSLRVASGEVVGLFGLVGAGRTEFLEAIFGVHGSRVEGRVFVDGKEIVSRSPAEAIAAGLALAPEDRKHDGLVLGMSSRENAGMASTRAVARWGLLAPGRESSRIQPLLQRLRLKARSLEEPVRNLSGGNQQKVVLAKWLATDPKVLLLDEPTRGIDVNAKNEIYTLIHELAAAGLAILLVSSELPEMLALSDRIAVLCEGRKTAEFVRAEATGEKLLSAALPRSVVS